MNSEHARALLSGSEMRNSENIYTSFSLLLQLATGKTTRECGEKICRARLSVWCNWNVLHSRRVVRDHRTLLSSSAGPSSQTLYFFSYSLARRTFQLIVVVGFTQQHQRTLHISHDLDIYCWHIIAQLHLALPPCVLLAKIMLVAARALLAPLSGCSRAITLATSTTTCQSDAREIKRLILRLLLLLFFSSPHSKPLESSQLPHRRLNDNI